jgi:hypothetical protein
VKEVTAFFQWGKQVLIVENVLNSRDGLMLFIYSGDMMWGLGEPGGNWHEMTATFTYGSGLKNIPLRSWAAFKSFEWH